MRLYRPQMRYFTWVIMLLALLGLFTVTACDSADERAQTYYEKGIKLLERGDPTKASLEFRNALKHKEGFVPALYSLGVAQQQIGHVDDAAKLYFNVIERAPENVDARVNLASILLNSGQLDDALKFADQAYALAPSEPAVLSLKAAIALRFDNRGEAIRLADAALKIDPENIDALTVRATERLMAGDAKGAVTFLARTGKEGEGNVVVQVLRTKAYTELKDNEGIERSLTAPVKTHPELSQFCDALVQWYLGRGRTMTLRKLSGSLSRSIRMMSRQNSS